MSRSRLVQTADSVIRGFNSWTAASVMSFRAPHCIHQILPLSLGRPSMTNAEWIAYFRPIMPAFQNFTVTVHDMIVDEQERKVSIWCSSKAMTALGEYVNEYVLVLCMTEDGAKVEKLLEFVDSGYSKDFIPRLEQHLRGQAKDAKI